MCYGDTGDAVRKTDPIFLYAVHSVLWPIGQIFIVDEEQRGWMVKVTASVDLEGLGSNPGAGKLDSGFQMSVKWVPASAVVKIWA